MSQDYAARQAALSPAQSFIVQAPAGSGKTGLLVYRLLTLLATVESPQQVLAITFTRKATAEMRERLVNLMLAARNGQQGQDEFETQGLLLAQAVLQRDAELGWNLLNAPHQLQILTIDAFCARLTGSMPWLSRLGDRPRTTDQADAHYAVAVEQLLTELLDESSAVSLSLQTVMNELDFNYARARQLFASMLARRDQWLRHFLQHDLAAMREELHSAWSEIVDQQMQSLRQHMPEQLHLELFDVANQANANIAQDNSPLQAFADWQAGNRPGLSQWRGLANLLLTTSGSLRKTVNKNLGFLPGSDLKVRFETLLKEHADDVELVAALGELRELPDPQFSDSDWSQLMALEQVLKSLAAFLQLRFRSVGECDHSEVTQRANLALQELENPTDLGLRLDYQIQHILVDEFQDTSHGQLELLKKLTAGWQYDDGRTLFLVGDPMQSIYRFREADVSLFLQVADNSHTGIFENIDIESLSLSRNFRSTQSLVSWFNRTFSRSFPQQNNVLTGAITYSSADGDGEDEEGVVDCRVVEDRDEQAQMLVDAVRRSVNDLPQEGDKVAILVRSRSMLDYLLPALQDAGIAYQGVDIQPLQDLQSVIDVITLCKAIARDDDRIAWLALLRGPWCGLTLAQIKQLAGQHDVPVWDQLCRCDPGQLPVDAEQRLSRFMQQMRATLAQRQQISLGSLTRWTWKGLGGDHTLIDASNEDIETVFELINELQRGGDLPSITELDNALQGLFARPANNAARVIVSTIHKAKGLQYHTVILPGLASQPRSDDKEVLMWSEYQDRSGDSKLLLAPFTADARSGTHYDYLRRLEKKRSMNETIRLMYVACTRAEQRLVLLGHVLQDTHTDGFRRPAKNTLLNTVWDAVEQDFEISRAPVVKADPDELPQQLTRLRADFEPAFPAAIDWRVKQQLNAQPAVPEEEIEFEWATEVATGVGIVLHDWLQHNADSVLTAEVDQPLIQRWRAELLGLRVPETRINDAVKRLTEAVENIQQDKSSHFLFAENEAAHNEYTLSAYESGLVNHYRLDRTFVDEQGVRWIVDYKSTDTNNPDVTSFVDEQVHLRHRAQLEKYAALMSQIDTRPIRLAVYFPLLKQLRSWDYQPPPPTPTE